MTFEDFQEKFISLLREIKIEKEKIKFLKWIHINWNIDCLFDEDNSSVKILTNIAEDIRSMVPFDAILPSEKISLPLCGPNSDCDLNTTIHVDEFLYNDEHTDELVDKGLLSRYYCADCFSKNIKLLTFISHSMSINRIQYLFKCLLPPLENEIILDVGSRLGAVLYGSYIYTASSKIIGVELNSDFCKIQNEIIAKYKFSDRVQVICNSIFNEIEVLSTADIVILNNVFEFFADVSTTISSWRLLAQNIKIGCILVTIPHLEDTFQFFKVGFDWRDWVEVLEPYRLDFMYDDEETLKNHQQNVKHYRVKKKLVYLNLENTQVSI